MAASSAVMTAISEGFGISEVQRNFGHSSRVTAPLSGNPQTLKEKLMFNIRWLTGLTGLALSLAAFLGFLLADQPLAQRGHFDCILVPDRIDGSSHRGRD